VTDYGKIEGRREGLLFFGSACITNNTKGGLIMSDLENVIVIDNGRYGVKIVTEKLRKRLRDFRQFNEKDRFLIRSVVAPGKDFKMNVDLSDPNYFLIERDYQGYMVGDLAIKQSDNGEVNRTEQKDTETDKILIACASSFVAENCDDLIVLTNCPVKNWTPENRREIAQSFEGQYSVTHKAGIRQGERIHYKIIKVQVLPEGAGVFYDYVYDDNLNEVKPDFLNGTTLVLDIGDQTINRLVFVDGEYRDELCGSIDSGLHKAHAAIQSQFEDLGVDFSLAEISDAIVKHKPLYIGREEKDVHTMAQKPYGEIASEIFRNVSGKMQTKRIRNVLIGGGGALNLHAQLKDYFSTANMGFSQRQSPWMNANGFRKMYLQMLKEKRNRAVING
jgi:hypothetical protein